MISDVGEVFVKQALMETFDRRNSRKSKFTRNRKVAGNIRGNPQACFCRVRQFRQAEAAR